MLKALKTFMWNIKFCYFPRRQTHAPSSKYWIDRLCRHVAQVLNSIYLIKKQKDDGLNTEEEN